MWWTQTPPQSSCSPHSLKSLQGVTGTFFSRGIEMSPCTEWPAFWRAATYNLAVSQQDTYCSLVPWSSLRILAVAVKFLKGECRKGGRHPILHQGGKLKCLQEHMQTKHLNEVTQWGPHVLYAKETAALQLRLTAAQTFTLFWEARNLCFYHNNEFKSLTLREPNKTCLWAGCQFEISDLDFSDFQPSLSTSVIDQGYVFFFFFF